MRLYFDRSIRAKVLILFLMIYASIPILSFSAREKSQRMADFQPVLCVILCTSRLMGVRYRH